MKPATMLQFVLARLVLVPLCIFLVTECPAQPLAPLPNPAPGQSSIRLNLGGTPSETDADVSGELEVVATGVGADPNQATQNAYTAAIEQVVGVLVDAETIVENDQVVRDKVLTFSRGFVNSSEEIARWEKDGLQYVRIRAKISATELGKKLAAQNVATREIRGGELSIRIGIARASEENAREMFRNAVKDFAPDKLLTLTILDQPPEVKDTGTAVDVTVPYRLAADMDAWAEVHKSLKPVLSKTSFKHANYTCTTTLRQAGVGARPYYQYDWESTTPLERVAEQRVVLYLFKGNTADCNTTYWDGFQVYASFAHEVATVAAGHARYRLRFHLVDSQNRIIAKLDRPLNNSLACSWVPQGYSISSIGPLPCSAYHFRTSRDDTVTFRIEREQLARVDTCVGAIEIVTADE